MAEAELNGVRKAAVLLLSLEQDEAAEILKRLPAEAVEEVSREIASMREVPVNTRADVFGEFYNLALANSYLTEGGLEYAKTLLRKSLNSDEASRIIKQVTQQVQTTPFAFLQKAESENLLTFIQDEHPQTIALILAHLPSQKASEILVGLPGQKQIEVVKHASRTHGRADQSRCDQGSRAGTPNIGLATLSARRSRRRAASIPSRRFSISRTVPPRRESWKGWRQRTRIWSNRSAGLCSLEFEDILLVNDKGIQSVLKEVENEELSLALKTASQELKDKILKNMSERAAQLIQEDMQYMGPVRVSDVEAAQQKIVDVVRRLEDAGEIIIAGRGGEKEMIV